MAAPVPPVLAEIPAAATAASATPSRLTWQRLRHNKALLAGSAILLLIVLVAVFAPWLSPHDPYVQDLTHRTAPPVWYDKGTWLHPLCTDQLCRDYLSLLFYGARI